MTSHYWKTRGKDIRGLGPSFERLLAAVFSAYPDGVPDADYLPLTKIINSDCSIRGTSLALLYLAGANPNIDPAYLPYAASDVADVDFGRVLANLVATGYEPDDE